MRPGASTSTTNENVAPISRAQAERNLYGGMTNKEVLGGEVDLLGSMGPYQGSINSGGAGLSWDDDVAARRAATPTYEAALPQVVIHGDRMTPDEQLSSLFGLDRKVVFTQAMAPSRIEAQQSIWSTYSNIAGAYRGNKIGFGDAVSMAWNNTKFAYRGSERTQGAVQAANGLLEVGGALTLSGTGVGAAVGIPLAFHGGDTIGTGMRRLWTGTSQSTVTYNGVEALTGSSRVAGFVDNAIPLAGGIVTAGNALRIAEQRVLNNMAYRSLTPDDLLTVDAGMGITAKAPQGVMTVEEHILNSGNKFPGGNGANNPWVGTSRSQDVARGYSSGNGTVPIYLGEVPQATQVELWQHAARNNNMYGQSMAYYRSVWAQEVSIYQHVPAIAIGGPMSYVSLVRPIGFGIGTASGTFTNTQGGGR